MASAFDLKITTADAEVEVMLQRPEQRTGARQARPISTIATPVRDGDRFNQQENEALYSDWSGGAGYGERLAPNVYHYGYPASCRTPRLVMPPGRVTRVTSLPAMRGEVRGVFESRHDIFFAGGDRALRIPLGSGQPYVDQNLNFYQTFNAWSAINWGVNGDGYIGGTGGGVWRFDGSTGNWGQSSEVAAQFLASVYWVRGNVGSQKMVRSTIADGPTTYAYPSTSILYSDNPLPMTEAVWSDEILVGNPAFSITGLAASNQHLYTLKSNGLHDLDDRLYSPNITAYRQNQHEFGNPKALSVHNGAVYFGSRRGLDRVSLSQAGVRQDRPQACEFGFGLPNYSPIRGEPTACVNEGGWLATAYYDEGNDISYLCYGIDYRDLGIAKPAGGSPLLWHGAEAIFQGKITLLYPCAPEGTSYAPRLYVWTWIAETAAANLDWVSLPQAGSPVQDLLLGGPMEFSDEWNLYLPRETWGNDTARKDQTLVSARSDGLGAATIDVYRSIEGDDFETESLGQASTPYDEFAVDEETNARDMTFKVTGRGTSSAPAMLKTLACRAGVSVEASDTITYLIEFGQPVATFAAAEQKGDPVWIEEKLRAMQGRRATITDYSRGKGSPSTFTARVLQGIRLDWEELPSGQKTGKVTGVLPVQILESLMRLDEGHYLDQGLRLA